MFMEENVFQKLIHTVKNKVNRNSKKANSFMNEYAFNKEDLTELQKNNKEKIKELKKELQEQEKKKEELKEENLEEEMLSEEQQEIIEANDDEEEENIIVENLKEENSYINLNKEQQEIIMKSWQEIDNNMVDKDIISGKEILNHNYTITYADDASKFINEIRNKYEIVICYLIGFNNEKKGIKEKTIFSKSIEDEWKQLF